MVSLKISFGVLNNKIKYIFQIIVLPSLDDKSLCTSSNNFLFFIGGFLMTSSIFLHDTSVVLLSIHTWNTSDSLIVSLYLVLYSIDFSVPLSTSNCSPLKLNWIKYFHQMILFRFLSYI